MSPRQLAVLGLRHDGYDAGVYGRICDGVHRLIALVDEFPVAATRSSPVTNSGR
jgi:hypothetical protein